MTGGGRLLIVCVGAALATLSFQLGSAIGGAAPANDNFAAAQVLSGASGTVTGSNVGATIETGEPEHAGVSDGASVWYSWTAPAAGSVTIGTTGSDFDTILAVYTGSSLTSLSGVASNDDYNGAHTSQVTFNASANVTYWIAVAGYMSDTGAVAQGNVSLSWSGPSVLPPPSPSSPPPANDNFASAQVLSGASGTVSGSNVGATLETGEPQHAGESDGASVWYSWTAPGSGAATIDTTGSSFDTILAVYTGSSLTALSSVASNDDYNGAHTSLVSFTATAGVTYRVAVAGYMSSTGAVAEGSVTLDWNGPAAPSPAPSSGPPPNDNFAAAQPLSGAMGTVMGSNVGATTEAGEPMHDGVSTGASIWYTWAATGSGTVEVDTAGSNFDTVLAVYTGTSLTALSAVAGNDDYNGTRQSQVTFAATAGTTYRIAVAGYSGLSGVSTGSVTLHWSGPASSSPPPGGDSTPPSVTLNDPTAGATLQGIVTLTATASDNVGVAKVEFLVNGAVVRTISSSPYTLLWDSTTVGNGSVTIAARATDASGNQTTTPVVTVGVQNSAPSGDPVVLAAGDIGECGSVYAGETAQLLGVPGATIATVGDHAYESGTAQELASCYDPTWGAVRARTRPSPGDHDYMTSNGAPYYAYFGSAAGDPAKGYYSYNVGAWHVVALNSNCSIVSCATGSAQEQWLKADLSHNKAQCTLAYFHEPLFTSSANQADAAVKPLWTDLYNAHAELVLNGHAHMYERFAPQTPGGALDRRNGITEIVVGTGGDTDRSWPEASAPNSVVSSSNTYGVLQLTLHATSYDWKFIPVPGETFTDSGSASCH